MATSKMLKVIDYVINEQEDKARELLHQIIIEKARAIHEEMMADESDEELGGDEGLDLGREIEDNKKQIESEEHYGMGTMEDIDLDSAVQDLDDELGDDDDEDEIAHDEDEMDHDEDQMDHDEEVDGDEETEDMGGEEVGEDHDDRLMDLEADLEELKKEFEDLKNEVHPDSADAEKDDDVEEGWMSDEDEEDDDFIDEDWDDLEESLDLDVVSVDAKKPSEVGSGKFARPETNTRSPVASNAPNMNGAKPIKTGQGKAHTGYALEASPKSSTTAMPMPATNRGIKSTKVSKDGDSSALINNRGKGFGTPNEKSPLGSGTTPKK